MQERLDNNNFDPPEKPGAWTKEACERTLADYLDKIEKAGTGFIKWPAYESVAIFLDKQPPAEDMAIFLERLKMFSEDMMQFGKRTGTKLTIKGVRLVKRETKVIETVVEEFEF